ncbi:hypothetical protein D7V97_12625 [Corallococcus sp. CA053C]|nr:hypothetical protein D7V97_12625 [Corallococcus sp. CA053C]
MSQAHAHVAVAVLVLVAPLEGNEARELRPHQHDAHGLRDGVELLALQRHPVRVARALQAQLFPVEPQVDDPGPAHEPAGVEVALDGLRQARELLSGQHSGRSRGVLRELVLDLLLEGALKAHPVLPSARPFGTAGGHGVPPSGHATPPSDQVPREECSTRPCSPSSEGMNCEHRATQGVNGTAWSPAQVLREGRRTPQSLRGQGQGPRDDVRHAT